jgi:hypothetical protein
MIHDVFEPTSGAAASPRAPSCPVLLALVAAMAVAGCDGPSWQADVEPVRGELFINGEPASGAMISLHPAGGRALDERGSIPSAMVTEDGSFEVATYELGDGAPAGEYVATFTWPHAPELGTMSPDRLGGAFADPGSSSWRISVEPGSNRLVRHAVDGVQIRDSPPAGALPPGLGRP